MHNRAAILLLGTAICLGAACAADPGDPLKTGNGAAPGGSTSSSSSGIGSSGGTGTSASSTGGSSGASGSGTGSGSGSGNGSGTSSGVGSSTSSGSGSSTGSSSGTGSSTGSSSGSSGGDDGGADAMMPGPTCITAGAKSAGVNFQTGDKAPFTSVQTVQFNLQITNQGFSTLSLGDVTVRYWFTADGNSVANIVFQSYYSMNSGTDITKAITAKFMAATGANATPTSDTYLELTFAASTGTISPLGGGAAVVQVAFHGPYSPPAPFNETNDYSFSTATAYKAASNITAYVKGQLVWGCEPGSGSMGGGGSGSSSGGSSGGSSSSSGGDGGGSSGGGSGGNDAASGG